MNRSNSVNAEDYLTISFRCRFNEVLPSDRRRALVEVWSDNCVDWGLREDFGRNLLTMAWNSPGLLQIELWNKNTGPGVVWANARLTGIFDGATGLPAPPFRGRRYGLTVRTFHQPTTSILRGEFPVTETFGSGSARGTTGMQTKH